MIGYRNNSSNITINTQVNTQPNQITALTSINKAGQTFYDILTQQPYKFSKNDISVNTYSMTLRWNYDLIIAMQENDIIAKLSNIADYTQNLPFIRKIYLDIAGNVDVGLDPLFNNIWIRLHEITISGDYNVYDYKHYVLQRENYSSNSSNTTNIIIHNIISKSLPFSIRVYGENYSANYPSIESRALIFNNLSFAYINPPYKPQFIGSTSDYSANVAIKNYVTLTYYNSYSVMLETSSNANITNYNIDYRLNDTLASYLISRNYLTNNLNIDTSFSSAIYSDMSFNIRLANLTSGSNYFHRIKVKNIYSNNYSEYSDISVSKYTLLPSNNGIGTNLDMSVNPICYKRISNNDLSNANILYFNVVNSAHKLIFNNNLIQPFQITYPYFDSQHLEPYRYGYGKFIDNSLNLVTITMSINSVLKQIINYGGFDVSGANSATAAINYNYSMNNYTNNRIIHNCNSIEDIYDNDTSYTNKGFRLKGYFSLIDEITNNNIINYFGDPSSSPYILNINYNRHPSVNTSLGSDVIHNIYIDNFTGDPVANNISNIVNVSEVAYIMSVASIKYFKLILYRTYTNINSIYKYIVGNNIIASFSTANSNISLTSQNIILPQADICGNGIYIYNDFSCVNIAYYQRTYHDFSFNLTEKIYNLNNRDGVTINNHIITNHYCDYNSFDISNNANIIGISKLDLNALNIYEISNIQLLGSDLYNIQLKHYNNHSNKIMPSTLLYINSCFSNDFSLYPNSQDFSYNNLDVDISYNTHGTLSYDLSGSINPLNNGYKWIVFKIYKSTDISNAYKFNNINYPIENSLDNIKYLPLKNMLKAKNLFTGTIVDNIFAADSMDALMFGHATTTDENGTYTRFFNVKLDYTTTNGIWTIHNNNNINTNAINYNSTQFLTTSRRYGSNVDGYGIYCPINVLNDDLTIYIGLKNNI